MKNIYKEKINRGKEKKELFLVGNGTWQVLVFVSAVQCEYQITSVKETKAKCLQVLKSLDSLLWALVVGEGRGKGRIRCMQINLLVDKQVFS